MIRRPIPKKPAPKTPAPKPPMPTAKEIEAIEFAKAHYRTGQTFISDAELLDLALTLEARHTATRQANGRYIEAAFAEANHV